MIANAFVFALLLGVAATAFGHGEDGHAEGAALAWPFAPEILAGTFLFACVYAAGMLRRREAANRASAWRHVSFFAGLAALLAALQSPLDAAAEHSFALHQVQHLFLQSVGPMLLMLAAPQAMLVAGMPQAWRAGALAAVVSNTAVRAIFGLAARPAAATLLLVGSLFFWHIPRYHDLALADDGVHYLMHFTMLASGLLFFWRLFDPRPAPAGAGYGVRLTMTFAAITATTPLGAFLALKSAVLYPGYDAQGRLWPQLGALQDEQLGGLAMWIPGGLILAVAALLVIRLWGARERLSEKRRLRELASNAPPARAAGVALRAKNRALAFRLLAISALMMVATILGAAIGQFY